ncbi:MAG: hypothetical protein JWR07_4058 [Nevskia sp.]|nr:hypothetical protein [Nevskia sp.]
MFRDQGALPSGVERVLIVGGAGAVGSLATQLLKAKTNAFVISTGSRTESKSWCTKMGADLVLDHSGDIPAQLAAANVTNVDMVLSTANTVDNLSWIAQVLRPFGHLSIMDGAASVDTSQLMVKAASIHMEMVFSRIINGAAPQLQGNILGMIADLVVAGRMKPIVTTRLNGLNPETMKAAHELAETGRTIGKIVIAM